MFFIASPTFIVISVIFLQVYELTLTFAKVFLEWLQWCKHSIILGMPGKISRAFFLGSCLISGVLMKTRLFQPLQPWLTSLFSGWQLTPPPGLLLPDRASSLLENASGRRAIVGSASSFSSVSEHNPVLPLVYV